MARTGIGLTFVVLAMTLVTAQPSHANPPLKHKPPTMKKKVAPAPVKKVQPTPQKKQEKKVETPKQEVKKTEPKLEAIAAQVSRVTISNFSFAPTTLKVKKGTTVTWTNQDSIKHNVVSDSGTGPGSALLAKGESYSYTFNTAGTFNYHCDPHPFMKGSVEVTE